MIQKSMRLLVAVIGVCMASYARAYDFWEDGIFYNVVSFEDKTVEVTHNGENSYSNFVDVPATVEHSGYKYRVVSVGDRAFYKCRDLSEVTLAEGVESLGEKSLSRITNLTRMTLPKSLKSIGMYAFAENSALKALTLNCDMVAVAEYAFYKCTALTTINQKGNMSSISDNAFDHCEALTSFSIPSGVTHIGECAFLGCYALTAFKVSADNEYFCARNKAIYSKDMTTLVAYPNAFEGAYTIPSGVTTIGVGAFAGCKLLTSLVIPASVTSIGMMAFDRCQSLSSITDLAVTPQEVREDMFATFGKLHVLAGCKAAYKAAAGWSRFTIVEDAVDTESAISATTDDVRIRRCGRTVVVEGAPLGALISVYSYGGALLKSQKASSQSTTISLPSNQPCVVKVQNP